MTLVEVAAILAELDNTGHGLVVHADRVRIIDSDGAFTVYSHLDPNEVTNLHFHGLLKKHTTFVPWWDHETTCYYCSKDGATIARFILDW